METYFLLHVAGGLKSVMLIAIAQPFDKIFNLALLAPVHLPVGQYGFQSVLKLIIRSTQVQCCTP